MGCREPESTVLEKGLLGMCAWAQMRAFAHRAQPALSALQGPRGMGPPQDLSSPEDGNELPPHKELIEDRPKQRGLPPELAHKEALFSCRLLTPEAV